MFLTTVHLVPYYFVIILFFWKKNISIDCRVSKTVHWLQFQGYKVSSFFYSFFSIYFQSISAVSLFMIHQYKYIFQILSACVFLFQIPSICFIDCLPFVLELRAVCIAFPSLLFPIAALLWGRLDWEAVTNPNSLRKILWQLVDLNMDFSRANPMP